MQPCEGEANEETSVENNARSSNVGRIISLISQKQAKQCFRVPTTQRALQTVSLILEVLVEYSL